MSLYVRKRKKEEDFPRQSVKGRADQLRLMASKKGEDKGAAVFLPVSKEKGKGGRARRLILQRKRTYFPLPTKGGKGACPFTFWEEEGRGEERGNTH